MCAEMPAVQQCSREQLDPPHHSAPPERPEHCHGPRRESAGMSDDLLSQQSVLHDRVQQVRRELHLPLHTDSAVHAMCTSCSLTPRVGRSEGNIMHVTEYISHSSGDMHPNSDSKYVLQNHSSQCLGCDSKSCT